MPEKYYVVSCDLLVDGEVVEEGWVKRIRRGFCIEPSLSEEDLLEVFEDYASHREGAVSVGLRCRCVELVVNPPERRWPEGDWLKGPELAGKKATILSACGEWCNEMELQLEDGRIIRVYFHDRGLRYEDITEWWKWLDNYLKGTGE